MKKYRRLNFATKLDKEQIRILEKRKQFYTISLGRYKRRLYISDVTTAFKRLIKADSMTMCHNYYRILRRLLDERTPT